MRASIAKKLLAGLTLAIAVAPQSTSCKVPSTLNAKIIAAQAEAIGGPAAVATVGDYLLENDQIRVAILGARHSPGPGVFGGSLVDADIRRDDARFSGGNGLDHFSEAFPIANLLIPNPGAAAGVSVVADGSDGEQAVIRVEGAGGVMFEALGLLATQKDQLELLFPGIISDLRFRTDYILHPGDHYVTMRTTLSLPGGGPGVAPMANYAATSDIFHDLLGDTGAGAKIEPGVVAGDFVFFGNQNDIFAPGIGYDTEKGIWDAIFSQHDTFKQPLSYDFVAASSGDVSYGYFTIASPGAPPSVVNVPIFSSAATAFLTAGRSCLFDSSDDATCDGVNTLTYERYFVVGQGDVSSVVETILGARGMPTAAIEGSIAWASSGQPAPKSQLFLFHDPAPGTHYSSVDDIAAENVARSGNVGLVNVIDSDRGLDPVLDGDFHALVAPGDYVLVARNPDGTSISAPIPAHLAAGDDLELEPALPLPGLLDYRITDQAGLAIPGKVTLISLDASGQPLQADGQRHVYLGDDRLANGVRTIDTTATGQGTVQVAAGRYRVSVSRGIEYSRFEVPDITIASGELTRIDASLTHEIDTSGFLSIDAHLHQLPSFDSGMDLGRRVTMAASEGVEVAVATDHDAHTDLGPAVQTLFLAPWVKPLIGAEVTTLELGHFIGFPLQYHQDVVPDHGVFDWVCQMPNQVLDGIRSKGDGVVPLTVVAHPRDGSIGYLEAYSVDPFTLERAPSFLQVANPLQGIDSCAFDAMEVFNEKRLDLTRTPTVGEVVDYNRCYDRVGAATDADSLAASCPEAGPNALGTCLLAEPLEACRTRLRSAMAWALLKRVLTRTPEEQDAVWDFALNANDGEGLCDLDTIPSGPVAAGQAVKPCTYWSGQVDDYFRFVEHGLIRTQIGSSDAHDSRVEPGTPRTFFVSPTDAPDEIQTNDIVDSLRAGRAFATYGPFIRADVAGKSFGEVAEAAPNGTVNLNLHIETASWFGVDRVEIYVGGRLVRVLTPNNAPTAIVDVNQTIALPVPNHDSWIVVIAMGLNDPNLLGPTVIDVPYGQLQLPRVASLALSQIPQLKTLFQLSPPVPDWHPMPPYAITNPIYLDVNGNGVYDAPGAAPAFCSHPCVPEEAQCASNETCLFASHACGLAIPGACLQATPK